MTSHRIVGAKLRSACAQTGVSCNGCGAVGIFFRSVCSVCRGYWDAPNAPSLTMHKKPWTSLNDAPAKSVPIVKEQPADGSAASNSSQVQRTTSYSSSMQSIISRLMPIYWGHTVLDDAKYQSMKQKNERMPYPARSSGEANLHIVLHKAVEILAANLERVVPDLAPSILMPCKSEGSRFYSTRIWNEDLYYFKRKLGLLSPSRRAHYHRGFLRALNGDVDDRDEVTNRGLAYCFDRSGTRGHQRNKETLRNFCQDPRAGKRNVHGHKDWVDITSTHDRYATTGRAAAGATRQLERSMNMQGAWRKAQGTSMDHKRECCAHLLSLITRELGAEAVRESVRVNNLPRDYKQKRVELVKLEKARFESADRIMRVIAEYGAVAPSEEADYLWYTVDIAKHCSLRRGAVEVKRGQSGAPGQRKN